MAQQKGKKVVIRRRRERKNIENGASSLHSTTPSLPLPIHRVMQSAGQALADSASEAPESLLRSQHRPQQKPLQRLLWNTDSRA